MIRAFLALALPDPLIHRLSIVQHGLRLHCPVPRENLHLTLAFLGAQPEPALEDLHLALENRVFQAPVIQVAGLGVFGGASPRNLHMRVDPNPVLMALQARVARMAAQSGIALERRKFVPHITLARFAVGEVTAPALAAMIETVGAISGGPFVSAEMVLLRSTLRASGPVYDPMANYPLIP